MEKRIENLRKILTKGEAAVITDNTNRLYFTNMPSSAGTLVITEQNAFLLIDFRYFEKAKSTAKNCEVILLEKLSIQLKELLQRENIKTVLFEKDNLTVSQFDNFVAFEAQNYFLRILQFHSN